MRTAVVHSRGSGNCAVQRSAIRGGVSVGQIVHKTGERHGVDGRKVDEWVEAIEN